MKVGKQILSFFLALLILVTSVPLGSLFNANAAYHVDGFSNEKYMAQMLLSNGCSNGWIGDTGKTVPNMQLDFYKNPKNVSMSGILSDALSSDTEFMLSVAAWETLTFSPTNIYNDQLDKISYYQTILFKLLDISVNYNFIPSLVKNTANNANSIAKSIINLQIKLDDVVLEADTQYSLDALKAEEQNKIIQNTAGHLANLEGRKSFSTDLSMLLRTSASVIDFAQRASALAATTSLTEDIKAVINELYLNCSFLSDPDMKTAVFQIKEACDSTIDSVGMIALEGLKDGITTAYDTFLSGIWGEAVASMLGSLGAGILIGQALGKTISNILFSTDKTIEYYYSMKALSNFESLMVKTVESLGSKFTSNQNDANAKNYISAVDLLFSTYSLDCDYANDYVDIVYEKGLWNKIKYIFVEKSPDVASLKQSIQSLKSTVAIVGDQLTGIEWYKWYIEEDYPEVYSQMFESSSPATDTSDIVSVACPTDVEIIDYKDNLLVKIVNDELEYCKLGYVANIDNSVKTIILPNNEKTKILITGTDSGTMDYTIEEFNGIKNARQLKFNDVPLTFGCTYTAELPQAILSEKQEYSLKSDDGSVIDADYDSQLPFESDIVDVVVAEELFEGFSTELIDKVAKAMFNLESSVDVSSYQIATDNIVALISAIQKYYPSEYTALTISDFSYKAIVSPSLDIVTKLRFYYGDDVNLSVVQKRAQDMKTEINKIVAQTEGMDDFEKALFVHDYLVLNAEYDLELLDMIENGNIIVGGEYYNEKYTEYSILVNGTGVCGSYALAYRAVLNALGMDCLYLSSRSMNHAWNMVKVGGAWYHVDCCWDDPVPDTYGRARRTYFLRTDDEIMQLNHRNWTPGQYKAASSKYSDMPRSYDIYQKYDYGTDLWYSLNGSTLYTYNKYGDKEEKIGSFSATSISVDNGKIYYSSGRNVYEYSAETEKSDLVYRIPNSKAGSNASKAYIKNMYVSGDTIEYYKYINDADGKGSTVYETDLLTKDFYASITGIELSATELSIDVFDTNILTATVKTSTGTVNGLELDWTSSNETVAAVDNGKITANNVGTAIITVSLGYFSVSCSVEVKGDGLTGLCGDNVKWTFVSESGTLTISGSGAMENYRFASLAPWYKFRNNILSVNIASQVTAIGDYAFAYCTSLTSVALSNSVTSIGDRAFNYCIYLTSVTIPNSVTSIGNGVFQECARLTSVIIPNSVTTISDYTFYQCIRLASVTIPNEVTTIGNYAFHYTSLTSVTIPNSVTSIGQDAFSYCKSLTSFVIPDSVTTIGSEAFYRCTSLKTIEVDKNNPAYSSDEFGVLFNKDKTKLIQYPNGNTKAEYKIPNSVTKIDDSSFTNCTNITTVTIPNSVTDIAYKAFYNCISLEYIYVDKNNSAYSSDEFGVLFNKDKTTLIQYPIGNIRTGYKIPNSVTNISGYAFEYCTSLSTVTIPNSVTTINYAAFAHCSGLISVIIPNSVKRMRTYAFADCTSLAKLLINNSECTVLGFGSDHILNNSTPTIYGHADSTAQALAESNNLKFVNIDAEPHTHDYFLTGYKEATPTQDGYEQWTCYREDDSYTTPIHYFGEEVKTEPTCAENGAVTKTCVNCGYIETVETLPATGKHNYVLKDSKAADCVNDGFEEYECSVCGSTYKKIISSSDSHKLIETIIAPTCTEKGYTKAVCTICGEVSLYDFTAPTGHNLTISKSSDNCSAHGTLLYSCSKCDYEEYVAVDASNLETKTVVVPATCTLPGLSKEVCTLCGATISSKVLAAKGHIYSDEYTVDKAADCTSDGSKSRHCTVCGAKGYVTVIPATGHKEAEAVTENLINVTCTENGSYDSVVYCSDCGKELSRESITVPANGHSFKDGVCENCGEKEPGYINPDCSHFCHSSNKLVKMIYRIFRFFWKLFGIKQYCSCGAAHY